MKLLIFFPNAANWAQICSAVPILSGIAKKLEWELDYFDTWRYKDEDFMRVEQEKIKNGGFKMGYNLQQHVDKTYDQITVDLQNKIDQFKPDLIAISALSTEYKFLLTFFNKIIIPQTTKVIIGGMHATMKYEEIIESKLFDLVAFGEGEETFEEVLFKIKNNYHINDIKGTYFYDKNLDVIVKNSKRPLLPANKLWETQRDFSFYEDDEYFFRPFDGKKIRRYEMETARGCPWNCAYCGNSALKAFNKGLGKYVKTRPIESSIKEMKILKEKFKVDIFAFQDECFFAHSKTWLKEFMDQYKLEINKPFLLMTRPETITEENIKLILSYDLPFQASIGVESGSEYILKKVCERTCTNEKVIKAFKILAKNKIRASAFFIVGFPFETREDVFKSINLCKKLKPSIVSLGIFQPYPGQKLTDTCINEEFITKDQIPGVFVSDSLLKMPEPYMSAKEIKDIWRVFMLYATLPKKYYKDIEKCENEYHNQQDLYNKLVKLRWNEYDFGNKKGDKKLI
jgi:radical SAM superfamily enzyme YgiQ (UPF0313 family)